MKRTFSRIALLFAFLFFVLGIGWGLWTTKLSSRRAQTSLIVLCPNAWLPTTVTERLAQKINVSAVQLDFENWSDFVRLAANTQGKADVVCFHSFLAMDLFNSKIIRKSPELKKSASGSNVSVDFLDLPFDPHFDYALPLYWGVNGLVVKKTKHPTSWTSFLTTTGSKASLLYPDLELFWRMLSGGLAMEEDDVTEESPKLRQFARDYLKSIRQLAPNSANWKDSDLENLEALQMASGPAGQFLKQHPDWVYWMPSDGVSFWAALVGVGSQSRHPDLALRFIDALLEPETVMTARRTSQHAVAISSLDSDDRLLPMQKASALRDVPLDHVRFPELSLENVPLLERLVDEFK